MGDKPRLSVGTRVLDGNRISGTGSCVPVPTRKLIANLSSARNTPLRVGEERRKEAGRRATWESCPIQGDIVLPTNPGVTHGGPTRSLTNDQITELVEEGSDTVHGSEMWCGDEPFAVHIILVASNIDEEMRVDDVFDLMPDDTTPTDFARACVLMGETMRAGLLTQRG